MVMGRPLTYKNRSNVRFGVINRPACGWDISSAVHLKAVVGVRRKRRPKASLPRHAVEQRAADFPIVAGSHLHLGVMTSHWCLSKKAGASERTRARLGEGTRSSSDPAIDEDPVLSKSAHGPLLPPSWRTLYELTNVEHPVLSKATHVSQMRTMVRFYRPPGAHSTS